MFPKKTNISLNVNSFPATKFTHEDVTPGIETCWELTEEDIQTIIKTKCIYVRVLGRTVPPMHVDVHSVFRKEQNKDEQGL